MNVKTCRHGARQTGDIPCGECAMDQLDTALKRSRRRDILGNRGSPADVGGGRRPARHVVARGLL